MASAPDRGAAGLAALHARLLRDRGLQFDFLAAPSPPPYHPPSWLKPLAQALEALGRLLSPAAGPALSIAKVGLWIGVAVVALLLLWVIAREGLGAGWARRRERTSRAGALPPPDPVRARALLENADRLAAQGRFDLAVRLILHRGVEDIETRRPRLLGPALTARDIAGLDSLPAAARAAFTRIAAIVEFSAFAGQPIGRSAFDQCRQAYQAFAAPDSWR